MRQAAMPKGWRRTMSVSAQERAVLIEKRARALTMMLLTRREDLLVEEVQGDIGLDYIVRFHSKGKAGLREFAVQVTGQWPVGTTYESQTEP